MLLPTLLRRPWILPLRNTTAAMDSDQTEDEAVLGETLAGLVVEDGADGVHVMVSLVMC